MFKNVLLLYKKSAYKIYFLDRKGFIRNKSSSAIKKQISKFKKAHEEHYQTLKIVTQALIEREINFTECFRGQKINYNKYGLIITVGGDGTFLEAARHAKGQLLLGVNSALSYSTGSFCIASTKNFAYVIQKILDGRYKVKKLQRMCLKLEGRAKSIESLNDALICHENPAMMSRYLLKLNGYTEEQKSSGLWIATGSGSSGAVLSAGGKKLSKDSKHFQYIPRELYPKSSKAYRFKGGILKENQNIRIISLMRQGVIYVDGPHIKIPFEYGTTLNIKRSTEPIKTFQLT